MKKICTRFVEESIKNLYPEYSKDAPTYAAIDGPMMVDLIRAKLFGDNTVPGWGIPFVTSFTTHKSNYRRDNGMLSQWRGYGGNDGVAIVLETKRIEEMLTHEVLQFEYFSCSVSEVVYYDHKLDLVNRFPKFFDALRVYVQHVMKGREPNEKTVLDNLERVGMNLLPTIGRLKHQAFREENECRIVVGLPHELHRVDFSECSDNTIRPFKKIHYRCEPCGSVPYVCLFEDGPIIEGKKEGNIPIARILVGPSRNQCANVETVRALVREFAGDGRIEVQQSEIPYVGSA